MIILERPGLLEQARTLEGNVRLPTLAHPTTLLDWKQMRPVRAFGRTCDYPASPFCAAIPNPKWDAAWLWAQLPT